MTNSPGLFIRRLILINLRTLHDFIIICEQGIIIPYPSLLVYYSPRQSGKFNMSRHQPMSARDRAIKHFQSLTPGPAKPGEATEAYKDVDDLAYALSRVP